jgi:uncharacterized LabA/DUF88 family protein
VLSAKLAIFYFNATFSTVRPGGYIPPDRPQRKLRPSFCDMHATMRRVMAYIDGFNLYHAIDDFDKPHLKWVDLWALSASICSPKETLVGVNYYSAYANWRRAEVVLRHREYVKALRNAGVNCVLAHFKEKPRQCGRCGAQWIAHEEKETDVAIAGDLIADAFLDRFDWAVIISADTDLLPAIKRVQQHHPRKTVSVVSPPKRMAFARSLHPLFEITTGRLAKCLLPETAQDDSGRVIYRRPSKWAPPSPS